MKKKTDEYRTVRIWKKTHKTLKLLAALNQESLVVTLDRLAEEEIKRAKERGTSPIFPYRDRCSGHSRTRL